VEQFKKASVVILFLVFFMLSTSFTYHHDTLTLINNRIEYAAEKISQKMLRTTNSAGENIIQVLGVEKVIIIKPENYILPEPVKIKEAIPCIIIAPDSIIASILHASPINASGMTLNPLGIVTIGEMSDTKLKEELYHWWDASRIGPQSYYAAYLYEFGMLCLNKHSSDDAYWTLPLETAAKEYAYR